MEQTNIEQKSRYVFIDLLRSLAIILMIFFHLFYDLSTFGFVDINFQKDMFWYILPRIIVTLFLLSVGMSMCLGHKENLQSKSYYRRLLKIGIGALLITLFTYFFFPKNWVYFGTLHCIFFISIVILPFLRKPKLSLAIALIILGLDLTKFKIPFFELPHASMDYIPLFPWVSVSLIGIFLYSINLHKIVIKENSFIRFLMTLSKNSFEIYIVHQPILYSFVYLVYKLLTK